MTGDKIFIEKNYPSRSVKIWVERKDRSKHYNLTIQDGILKEEEIPEGAIPDLKPFLHLPADFADFFFRSLSEIHSELGIKPKDQSLIEGKLQATQFHLEDMRKISLTLIENLTK